MRLGQPGETDGWGPATRRSHGSGRLGSIPDLPGGRENTQVAPGRLSGAVHDPDAAVAGERVLPEDVGVAVAIEVAGARNHPAGGNAAHGEPGDFGGPVHGPRPVLSGRRVLPKDIGVAVAIEIARADHLPGSGVDAQVAPGCLSGAVHDPDAAVT